MYVNIPHVHVHLHLIHVNIDVHSFHVNVITCILNDRIERPAQILRIYSEPCLSIP